MGSRQSYGLTTVDVDLPVVNNILITAKSATRVITVLKVVFVPSAFAAGTLTFVDSISRAVIGAINVPDNPSQLSANWGTLDFGENGTKLTAGANLLLGTTRGVGPGRLHIDAVQKGR